MYAGFKRIAPEKVGSRKVVFNFEYRPDEKSMPLPEIAWEIIQKPFLSCRVWVNLVDALGAQVHCVELIGFQFSQKPKIRLKLLKTIWDLETIKL